MTGTIAAVVALLLSITPSPSLAGQDVVLYDAKGNVIKPAPGQAGVSPEMAERISIRKTCGDCHEVDKLAAKVHFNRGTKGADPESSSCLACHVTPEKAFGVGGTIRKTVAPGDWACVSCHSDLDAWSRKEHQTHQGMSCMDCHKEAGHKKLPPPSCRGCHMGKTTAPHPIHEGLPSLHLRRLACETCHITKTPDGANVGYTALRAKMPAYTLGIATPRRIWPVSEDKAVVHHNVAPASSAIGKGGCTDCHSMESKFFFGKTLTSNFTPSGKPVSEPNYKSMRITRTNVEISELREAYVKPISGWVFVFMVVISLAHYLIFGPRRVRWQPNEPEVQRFTPMERIMHLAALVSFLILALTGMTFLFHLESPSAVFRTIHACVGPLLTIAILFMLAIWSRHAMFESCDKDWVCHLGGYLWIRGDCPAEKFNAGQKLFYWFLVIAGGLTVSVTGVILLLMHGFAPPWAYTLHDLAGIAIVAGIIGHAYLSIFANPGTIYSMLTGRVKRSWAEHHHPLWLRRHDMMHPKDQDHSKE